jgi:hypothetical protein
VLLEAQQEDGAKQVADRGEGEGQPGRKISMYNH